jgi:tripartite-type tricarboxylate transporter receptor subunit TctC
MKNRKREICTSGSVRDEDGQPPHLLGHRRQVLHLAAGAAALPAASRVARAQAYPSRPVRIVAATAPGGLPDIVARLIGPWLSERLGQQFVVENRPGGGSNIGTEAVVRAPPDGYTLLLVSTTNAINATLYDKLNFNFIRDIAPAAGVMRVPSVVVIHPSVPAKTIPEFIAYAKANPGKINLGSPGVGTPGHVAGELFKMMVGVDLVHVPYRGGGPVMTDLLGGQVQVLFGSTSLTIEQIRAGKLRPLAVTTTTRWEGLPDIPTVDDFVSGYEASAWAGFGAPKNTPTEIVDKLNSEINAGLADPKIKARLADLGGVALPGSPADFGKLIAEEIEKWGKVIRAANIKPQG